jgi:hypothetical protein
MADIIDFKSRTDKAENAFEDILDDSILRSQFRWRKWLILAVAVLFVTLLVAVFCWHIRAPTRIQEPKSNDNLQIIEYKGSCQCPDDVDSAGNLCGRRSAYSRGAKVMCDI